MVERKGWAATHAGGVALLLGAVDFLLRRTDLAALLDERRQLRIVFGERLGQRMLGRDADEARAEDRVGARGEHLHLGEAFGQFLRLPDRRKRIEQALALADPVALHDAHLLRPLIERIEARQQLLAILGDLEEPLREFFLLDDGARTPAAAVDDLLVGEHGVIDRVPVHLALLAVDEARFVEGQEQPLLLVIIFGIAGGELARPIERKPDALQLRAHDLDILVGPFARVDALLHGRVLGGQAERVPAERVQHAEALGPLVARDRIAHHIIADMAHMDAPRRIGKHLKHVVFRLALRRPG